MARERTVDGAALARRRLSLAGSESWTAVGFVSAARPSDGRSRGPANKQRFQRLPGREFGDCTPCLPGVCLPLGGVVGLEWSLRGAWQRHPHGQIGRLVREPLTTLVPRLGISVRQDQGCVTSRRLYFA